MPRRSTIPRSANVCGAVSIHGGGPQGERIDATRSDGRFRTVAAPLLSGFQSCDSFRRSRLFFDFRPDSKSVPPTPALNRGLRIQPSLSTFPRNQQTLSIFTEKP